MSPHRPRASVVGGLALVALMATAAAVLADEPPRITQAVNTTEQDPNPSRMYAGPDMAVDPGNPDHMVGVAAEIRGRTCGLVRSTDGGLTWEQPDASPMLDGYPFCFQTETGPPQAVVAFGRDGALYYAYDGWDVEDTLNDWPIGRGGGWRGNVSVIVSRSTDLGDTWQSTVVRDARGLEGDEQESNRPVSSIAVDTTSGNEDIVYLGWKATLRDRDREQVLFAVSTDGGQSFSEPTDLTGGYFEDDTNRERLADGAQMDEAPDIDEIVYFWPDMTVADDGTLYAVWNARFGGGPQMDRTGTYLSTSTDGGETIRVTELTPAPDTYRYPELEWTEHGGPEGTLHLAYEAQTPEDVEWVHDVYHERSTDGGQTWSSPVRLSSDDPDDLVGQYHPGLAIAPDGRIDIAWWDFRNDNGNFANDVYLASSTDNGATWSPDVRVTDRSIDRHLGVWYGNADIRQAPGMAAREAYTVVAWDDTRNADEATHTQDIYSAAVQFSPVQLGMHPAVQYALAVAVGLAVFGLLLMLLAGLTRRHNASVYAAEPREELATP